MINKSLNDVIEVITPSGVKEYQINLISFLLDYGQDRKSNNYRIGSGWLYCGNLCSKSWSLPLMISGLEQGGQLMITTDVENYPGFENPIQGPLAYGSNENQAQAFGTRIKNDFVKEITFEKRPFELITEKESINSHSVIIATGAQAKWLNVKGEKEFMGYGVSACATCDGFFKGKEVAVIGGGNTAAEESLFLSNLCEKVYLIHRRNKLRAEYFTR